MTRCRWYWILGCLLTGFAAASVTSAQELVGQKVMTIEWDVDLKVERTIVHTAPLGQVFTVDQQQGNWLWIRSHRGWIDRSSVVPYEQAIEHFNQQLQESPSAINHYHRGLARQSMGDLDQAIADYEQAIRLAPETAAYFVVRGNAWNDKGEHDRAIADYDEAIRLDRSGAAYHGRGDAWYEKGDYDKAIADYTDALGFDPAFTTALNNRGIALLKQGQPDAAIADFDQAIRLDPRLAAAYNNRGRAKAQMQRYDEALADFNQAIEISPNDPWPYNDRAWLWATAAEPQPEDGQQAIESATKACELTEWRNSTILTTLAAAYAQAGEFDSATEWIEKAMGIDDQDRDQREKMLAYFRQQMPFRQ